jgi:uncharacterized protein (TIGR00299 family) protein
MQLALSTFDFRLSITMTHAYLDLFTGLSGDMFLGLLADAGCPLEVMQAALADLPLALSAESVTRGGLRGTLVRVTGPEDGPDHRSYLDLAGIVSALPLEPPLRARAQAVLLRLAQAEAAVHGVPVDQVHFHELGGLDTIADIVGAVTGLVHLGIDRLTCSPIPLSHGFIDTAHGRLPVPPPAVMELIKGAQTRPVDLDGETVTPTGAALALTLSAEQGPPPPMTIRTVAYGAGRKNFPEAPNLVRLLIGEPLPRRSRRAVDLALPVPSPGGRGAGVRLRAVHSRLLPTDDLLLLETNLDDMNPELQPALLAALFAAGAVDAWLTPIIMKKGRPALLVTALAPPASAEAVTAALLEHSTTFGVRLLPCARRCLQREMRSVETPWGPVAVKVGFLQDRIVTASPEYEDCARLAAEHGLPVKRVYAAALGKAEELITEDNTGGAG